jgi:hypothetical protein
MLMLEVLSKFGQVEKRSKKKLLLLASVGLVLTGVGLTGALLFGGLYYQFRRATSHENRLYGILEQTPTLYQVTEGLKEKAPLLASPESVEELEGLASRWPSKRDEIIEKASTWPLTRVFDAGDMIYFVYFDEEEVMKDFTYVDNPDYKVSRSIPE